MNRNAVIHGSYFANNFGDTLLINKTIDLLKKNQLYEYFYTAIKVSRPEAESIPVGPFHYKESYDLIYTGGGYLGENALSGFLARQIWGFRNIFRHFIWRLGRRRPDRLIYLCVGFGPISNPLYKFVVMRDLWNADLIVFRDQKSADLYKSYGGEAEVVVLCDLILIAGPSKDLDAEVCEVFSSNKFRLGIHLQSASLERISEIAIAIKEAVESVGVDPQFVVFFDAFTRRRNSIVNELKNHLGRDLEVQAYTDEARTRKLIKGLNCVVSSKLHVGIVSLVEGVSVASFPEHSKTSRLYSQLGLENRVLERNLFSHSRAVDLIRTAISEKMPTEFEYASVCRRRLMEKFQGMLR